MSLETKLKKINSLGSIFDQPVVLSVEKSNSRSTNPETQTLNRMSSEKVDSAPGKAKHFWLTRVPINPECKVFFSSVKPENAPKGYRELFFFAPPLFMLLNEETQELKMFPQDSKIFIEGRFLVQVHGGKETYFSIKIDLKKFSDMINCGSTDPIRQFFVSCEANGILPKPTLLTSYFYNQVLINDRFFILVSELPGGCFNQENLEQFVWAIDPFMHIVLEILLDSYFKELTETPNEEPENVFVFRLLHAIIGIDDSISKGLKPLLERSKNNLESFVANMENCQFNGRTKMMLHILYSTAKKNFPGTECPEAMIISVIAKNFAQYMDSKGMKSKFSDFKSIANFQKGLLSTSQFKRLKISIEQFRKQPDNFSPALPSNRSYECFLTFATLAFDNLDTILTMI